MGTKVHPKAFRTGVIYSWDSKWFVGNKRKLPALLKEDHAVRKFLTTKLKEASVDRIEIERTPRAITVTVHAAKPGVIIGRGGEGAESLKKEIRKHMTRAKDGSKVNLNLNIVEVPNPSLSAAIVAQSMIAEIEKRMPFRRVLKQHLSRVEKAGAKGVRLVVSGRLNGAEIARREKAFWGSVPLHNLRADISYASDFARTLFGTIGVKVWIYRGEVFADGSKPAIVSTPAPRSSRDRDDRGPRRPAPRKA
jgi:small subunit ribosomal protein S3